MQFSGKNIQVIDCVGIIRSFVNKNPIVVLQTAFTLIAYATKHQLKIKTNAPVIDGFARSTFLGIQLPPYILNFEPFDFTT